MCTFQEVKKYNNYRDELMAKIQVTHNSLVNSVKSFNGEDKKPINRKDLESFPFMQWVDINNNIRVRKRKNRFSVYLNFDTEMKKGAEFGEHFHADIVESCEVIKGELYDELTGITFRSGDVANYDKNEKHKPIAIKDSYLHVLFK